MPIFPVAKLHCESALAEIGWRSVVLTDKNNSWALATAGIFKRFEETFKVQTFQVEQPPDGVGTVSFPPGYALQDNRLRCVGVPEVVAA